MYTKEQQEEFLKQSNRSFKPDTDSRDFQQAERLRKEYAQGQAKMRQWNAELVEYERMKAYYKSLGEEPPYKTLGGFRRAKRAGSESYKEARNEFLGKVKQNSQNNLTSNTNNAKIKEREIDIEIDIATPCLIDEKTGEIVKTEMENVAHKIAKELDATKEYSFNWQKVVKDNPECTLAVLRVKGEKRIEGVVAFSPIKSDNAMFIHDIEKSRHNRGKNGKYAGVAKHLFAYVSKLAFEKGFDCIEFLSKSSLMEYYKQTIDAKNARGQYMFLTKEKMQELVDIYYPLEE